MQTPIKPLLIIGTVDGGKVQVLGPVLGDKVAAYGLLEIAKEMIRDHHAAQAAGGKIEVAGPELAAILANRSASPNGRPAGG